MIKWGLGNYWESNILQEWTNALCKAKSPKKIWQSWGKVIGTYYGLQLCPPQSALIQFLNRNFTQTSDHCLSRKVEAVWVGRKLEAQSLFQKKYPACHQNHPFLVVFHTHLVHLLSVCSRYQKSYRLLYCVHMLKKWGRESQSR